MSEAIVNVAETVTDVSVTDSVVNIAVSESTVLVLASSGTAIVEQVQADYTEPNVASFAYIKNKPDLSSLPSDDETFVVVGGSLGTQPTFDGDPLFSGSFVRTGALVHFQIQVEFDNITSFGTGQYYLDLPFSSKYNYQFSSGCLHDISADREYPIFGHVFAGENRVYLQSLDNQGSSTFQVDFTHNNPITLSTADNFHVSGLFITSDAI